jgi:dihydrodipicolinate synthase/N-acetylneuraminate lyase
MFIPSGVNAAMATPFTGDGCINEPVLRQWIDFMIDNGISGLFPISSVGEFFHLSLQDSYKLMDIVVEQAAGRVPVFPGTCSTATDTAIKMAKYAEKLGCPAVVGLAPHYVTYPQEIIRKHFEKLAGSVNISVIMYNIPAFTTPINLDTFEKLLNIRNIVAIKDSGGNMNYLIHMIDLARQHGREDFAVFTGYDDMQYSALDVGAAGCISAACGAVPEISTQIYREYKAGNREKAFKLQQSLWPLLRTMSSIQFPVGYKLSLEARGFHMGPPRLPIDEVDKYHYLSVRKKLQEQMGTLLGPRLVAAKQPSPFVK